MTAVGARANLEDALNWMQHADIMELGLLADAARRQRHGRRVTYRRSTHVVATAQGWLHFGSRKPVKEFAKDVRILTWDEDLSADARRRMAEELSGETFIESVPAELDLLQSMGVQQCLIGPHEIFQNRVRAVVADVPWDAELAALRQAMAAGLKAVVSLPYGRGESDETLCRRLLDLRDIQDAAGRIDTLALVPINDAQEKKTPGEVTFGRDDMRLLATARRVLDNVEHIQVPWLAFGFKAGQMALLFGADDLGPWCLDPAVTSSANLSTYLAIRPEELEAAIRAAGFEPTCRVPA